MQNRKLFIFRILLLVGTGVSLYFVPWLLVKAWILPLPKTVQEEVSQAIDHGFDGVIVYVDQANQDPQFYSAGWHNKELKTPANPQALFKIASISKLFVAVAVTKLVGKGLLSLDTPITYYLPELEGKIENANSITVRLLVQHKSGIPNYTDTPDFWATPSGSYEETLALITNKPANFKPGTDYEYCNTNYLLLSKIMDAVLGYDNFQFIEKEIIKSTHLNNTFEGLASVNMENVMSGYHVGHPFDLKEDDYGMVATAKDVGLFLRALNNRTIFESNEKEIYSSIYEYEHSGWVPGYQSFANYDRELDAVVVSFYSTTDADLYYWNLSEIINSRIIKILGRS